MSGFGNAFSLYFMQIAQANGRAKRKGKSEEQFGRKVWVVGGLIGKQKTPSQIIDGETGARLR